MITPVQINAAISKTKKENKTRIIQVEKGLLLRISAKGTALWCGKLKFKNKTHNKSFGHFPRIQLIQARKLKDDWEEQIKGGNVVKSYTVEEAFNDWWERKKNLAQTEVILKIARLHLLPELGGYQLRELTAFQCITAWKYLEDAGKFSTLIELCSIMRQMSIFVQNTGRLEEMHDLTHISSNYTRSKPVHHRNAVAPANLTDVFYEIETRYLSRGVIYAAIMTTFYTLSRSQEVASMQWKWVDFDNAVIHFPADVMKKRRAHDVPISSQLNCLLKSIERKNDFVFYSSVTKTGHINKSSMYSAFVYLKLNKTQTIHGIRAIGSSWFAEQGINEEVAEACLAHATGSSTRRAYQRSELLEKRRPVMQAWCDYVEKCHIDAINKVSSKDLIF